MRRPWWDRWEVFALGMVTFWVLVDGLRFGWLVP